MIEGMRPRQHATEALKKETKREALNYVQDQAPPNYHDLIFKYLAMWWDDKERVLASVEKQRKKMADLRR